MKIIKYILIIGLLFGLWVTRPLWTPTSTYTTNPTVSSIDTQVSEQKRERHKLITTQDGKKRALEAKFGKKPAGKHRNGVPPAVEKYWNETLDDPSSLEEEICSPIRASANGWITVCRYREKGKSGALQLKQNTYIIKNGKVIK